MYPRRSPSSLQSAVNDRGTPELAYCIHQDEAVSISFSDTAGIDDTGALGELRAAKTRAVLDRTDLAVLVSGQGDWSDFEERLLEELRSPRRWW